MKDTNGFLIISSTGVLMIAYKSSYGLVGDRYFSYYGAQVACKQIRRSRFMDLPSYYKNQTNCPSGVPINLDQLNCRGNESLLSECPNRGWQPQSTIATQKCVTLSCHNPDQQDQTSGFLGRFYGSYAAVRYQGEERYICDQNFSKQTGDQFCRIVSQSNLSYMIYYVPGVVCPVNQSVSFWITNLSCIDSPAMNFTTDCQHNGWGVNDTCGPNNCMQVYCYRGKLCD